MSNARDGAHDHECHAEKRGRVERVACMFALDLEREGSGPPDMSRAAADVERVLRGGRIALACGASGAGKSTLLRAVAERARRAGRVVIDAWGVELPERACVECVDGPLEEALGFLARAGLGEARCFVRRPSELSEGQRFRLRLALALRETAMRRGRGCDSDDPLSPLRVAERPSPRGGGWGRRGAAIVVVDEFAATLDRVTARAVAGFVRKFVDGVKDVCVLAATSHDDVGAALAPDVVARFDAAGRVRVERGVVGDRGGDAAIVIGEGGAADYAALAHWHYRGGAPATIARVLVARAADVREPIGVLVASMPTLNGAWRRIVWGEAYASGDRRRDAARLNEEVRCLSRVIVDPRFRALGVARRLVRAHLDSALTVRTEAVAAMGCASGFFAAAGMREWRLAPPEREARLLDALEHAGVEAWAMARPGRLWESLSRRAWARAFVERELRVWASSSRATCARRGAAAEELLRLAARRVGAPRVVYTHERGEERG